MKKYCIFVKNAKLNRHFDFLLDFLKLHKVLSICAKFQVFSILPTAIKLGGG